MNKKDDTVYILDSYGLIYRCYFAFISRPLTNSKGENVSALFGFFRNLHSILEHYKPSYIIAAMDSKTPTFRHKIFDQYKANRPKTPEDLHAQIPWICDVLGAMGIPTLQCDGYEADDIIATVASQCEKAGRNCRILSGDKDLMQLVTETTQILKPDHADVWKVIGREGVKAEWGVYPEKMLDLLSLYGDTADNIPGVKGCGVKTACKFLDQYGDLDGIYQHADEIKGAIGQKIRDGKESAYQSRELVRLCTEVPCDEIDITKFTSLSLDFSKAAEQLMKYEIPSCAKLYNELALGKKSSSSEIPTEAKSKKSAAKTDTTEENASFNNSTYDPKAQLEKDAKELKDKLIPLHKIQAEIITLDCSKKLEKAIEKILAEKKEIAISVQTLDEENYSSALLGISFASSDKISYYIPFSSGEDLFSQGSLSVTEGIKAIQKLFDQTDSRLIFHDMKFTYKVLRHNGLKCLEESDTSLSFFDTMIASWLLDPEELGNNPYALDILAEKKLAILKTEYDEIVSKDNSLKDADQKDLAQYIGERPVITLALYKKLNALIKKFYKEKLFNEMELPLIPILSEMELRGIHLDTNQLYDYSKELSSQISNLEKEIFSIVGHEFNIASTKQLQEVLFTERGLKPSKKTKTGYSTDTSVLEELSIYDPVPKKILEYRELSKLLSTYVEALPKLTDEDSLIHTTFVQTGTATGRLSCKDPNLQNIPVRSEQGRRIRSAFTSKPGTVFISADYSQIELVVMAHLSKDPNMCKAFTEGTDVHKATASLIYKVPQEEVTADMRRLAKTINFGVIYGMSAFRLSNELGISRTQAQEFITSYFTEYASIQRFISETIQEAHEKCRVSTIFGRSRFIPTINNANKNDQAAAERIAVNTPIQGSAADIVKMAMLKVNTALRTNPTGAKMLLQVHDELIFECPDNQEAIDNTLKLIKENMENAVKLSIPLRVSIEYGKNWGEFH
ncbi:MAG: DNA polymerase I [Treponema sp.]|uniref:DNA polymerase I n=1 Tax=Treponema sp. TaxID=166 RepID=UPI00298D8FFC|nr:DNA polymerase I [Treponema sp.]MDD5811126.1 DNA polymerase I [Treponema sp.]